jgi:hypothetical protein
MNTFFKAILLIILWWTGILGQILIVMGGILIWAGSVLTPSIFWGVF